MAWHTQPGPPLEDGEDEYALKGEFAAYLAKNPGRVREAAYMVFRHDIDVNGNRYFGRAMQAIQWESDPFVQEEIERLSVGKAVESLHPSPEEFDLEVLKFARSTEDAKVKLGAFELYAKLRGRDVKGGTTVNVDNRAQTVNVLSVPTRMTVEEAKQAFIQRHGTKTIEHASSRPH